MNHSIIPDWREDGRLPSGIYWASKEEIDGRFGFNDHRRKLLKGFWQAAQAFRKVGVNEMLINGSFVTNKEKPGDIDACWSLEGADLVKLRSIEPVLLDLSNHRARQKAKFGCEFFPAEAMADEVHTFDEFFQFDRDGKPKGIVGIRLKEEEFL